MGWIVVNLFLFAFIAIAVGILWFVGFLMWRFGYPPDDYPMMTSIAILIALVAVYFTCKRLHAFIARFIR